MVQSKVSASGTGYWDEAQWEIDEVNPLSWGPGSFLSVSSLILPSLIGALAVTSRIHTQVCWQAGVTCS